MGCENQETEEEHQGAVGEDDDAEVLLLGRAGRGDHDGDAERELELELQRVVESEIVELKDGVAGEMDDLVDGWWQNWNGEVLDADAVVVVGSVMAVFDQGDLESVKGVHLLHGHCLVLVLVLVSALVKLLEVESVMVVFDQVGHEMRNHWHVHFLVLVLGLGLVKAVVWTCILKTLLLPLLLLLFLPPRRSRQSRAACARVGVDCDSVHFRAIEMVVAIQVLPGLDGVSLKGGLLVLCSCARPSSWV